MFWRMLVVVFLNSLSNYLSLGLRLLYMLEFKENKCQVAVLVINQRNGRTTLGVSFTPFLRKQKAAARLSIQQQDVHFVTFVLPPTISSVPTRRGRGGGRRGLRGSEPLPARVFFFERAGWSGSPLPTNRKSVFFALVARTV